MSTVVSRVYNGFLNCCISNRQLKLEIRRKGKEVKGNSVNEEKLATEFLKKAKSANERYENLRGKESLQALEEWDLYFQAACKLVGPIMAMAIQDSLSWEESNRV